MLMNKKPKDIPKQNDLAKFSREFALGVLHILPNCKQTLRKNLKDEYYVLNQRCIVDTENHIVSLSSLNQGMIDFFGKGIAIQAIVGVNGSGKSSLFELIYRIINNLSCLLNRGKRRKASEQLYYIDDLWAELFVIIDGKLFCIACNGDSICVKKDKFEVISIKAFENNMPSQGTVLMVDFIKWAKECLFYTIVSNYSMQAFNAIDYGCESCFLIDGKRRKQYVEDRIWVNSLFHKNDGYLTPIVLNPYRNNGSVDMNREYGLTIYRLSSAMIYAKEHNKEFMKDYQLHKIHYTYSDSSLKDKYVNIYNVKDEVYWNYKPGKQIQPDYGTVILNEYGVIGKLDYSDTIQHAAAMYLIYKTYSIANAYTNYEEFFNMGQLKEFTALTDSATEDLTIRLVRKIKKDKSHISLKVRQMLHFIESFAEKRLNTNSLLSDGITYQDYVNSVAYNKRLHTMGEIQEYLPPSLFCINITLDKYENNTKKNEEPIPINRLSSGERQYLYTFSTYIYHILNLLSIQDSNRVRYRRMNLIFDEVEICFHPEFQRRFINELLGYIKRLGMNRHATFCITIATHSPFILSDIPQSNILYLENGKTADSSKFKNPFAANICDVLFQSFFLKNGFIGEYARQKVNNLLKYLCESHKYISKKKLVEIEALKQIIGDPFIKMHIDQLIRSHEKNNN